MMVFILLVQVSFLISEAFGYRPQSRSCLSTDYPCFGSSSCIGKNQWCDGSMDCNDNIDEVYCEHYDWYDECDEYMYYRCKTGKTCIPKNGYCDGYVSCPDGSDETDCPCETLEGENGTISRSISIGYYQTHQMCWRLMTTDKRYLNLNILVTLESRPCTLGNITVISTSYNNSSSSVFMNVNSKEKGEIRENENVICPSGSIHRTFPVTVRGEVKIRYRSSLYTSEEYIDIFNITYNMVDRECLNSHSFKCSENSCISLEKICDGKEDCENGLDEINCDISAHASHFLQENLKNAVNWMRSQRNTDWGWKENTGRAVVALHLGGALNFTKTPKEDDLIAMQLELELSTHLLRSKYNKISPSELSVYINALLAICHNPRNFFGFDLVQKLKEEVANETKFLAPLPYLTLCNAKEYISQEVVDHLLHILEKSANHGFILEIQALSLMALSCVSKADRYLHLAENISEALNNLKLEQKEDGSFGNEYTTSLVVQAFIANNQTNQKDWNFKSAIEFLKRKQKSDGSFGDFLTTYLAMPIFNAKSLVDIGNVNCTKDIIRPKGGNLISDIKSRLGGKIHVKYSLFVGDQKDQIHPIFLRVPENITAFEVMALAADVDPKYKFKTHEIKKKTYVYEMLNIPNDPEDNKFWFLYHDVENGTLPVSTQAPGEMQVHENDHIIMWYKTLNIL